MSHPSRSRPQPILLQFPFERPRFVREYATGSYGVVPYFLSKLFTELPLTFATSLLVFLIIHWMLRLRGSFILHVLITWIISLAASSIALLFGCLASNVQEAMQAAPAVFVPQILFAGLFVKLEQVPVWIRWAQYLCSLKYTMNLYMVNEFGDASCDPARKAECNRLLDNNNVQKDIWWYNVLVLVGLFCLFRGLGLVALARKARGFALA